MFTYLKCDDQDRSILIVRSESDSIVHRFRTTLHLLIWRDGRMPCHARSRRHTFPPCKICVSSTDSREKKPRPQITDDQTPPRQHTHVTTTGDSGRGGPPKDGGAGGEKENYSSSTPPSKVVAADWKRSSHRHRMGFANFEMDVRTFHCASFCLPKKYFKHLIYRGQFGMCRDTKGGIFLRLKNQAESC